MKNNIENNKLIAEFMNLPLVPCKIGTENGIVTEGYLTHHNSVPFTLSGMQYKYKWDWLMEVVERINLIDDYRFTVYIASMDTRIEDNVTGNIVIDINCKHAVDELIESVYEAVVEFIKWYNSVKENTFNISLTQNNK